MKLHVPEGVVISSSDELTRRGDGTGASKNSPPPEKVNLTLSDAKFSFKHRCKVFITMGKGKGNRADEDSEGTRMRKVESASGSEQAEDIPFDLTITFCGPVVMLHNTSTVLTVFSGSPFS